RLALRLRPASITELLYLIEADHSGRPPLPPGLPEEAKLIGEMATAEQVSEGPQPALILGRHVLPYFNGRPGKHIGEITRAAYDAQMDGACDDEAGAAEWLAEYMKSG